MLEGKFPLHAEKEFYRWRGGLFHRDGNMVVGYKFEFLDIDQCTMFNNVKC